MDIELSQALKARRKAVGLSPEAVAAELEISRTTFWKLEKGVARRVKRATIKEWHRIIAEAEREAASSEVVK